jgi:hypothetical protein
LQEDKVDKMEQKEEWRMQEGRYWREKEGYENN